MHAVVSGLAIQVLSANAWAPDAFQINIQVSWVDPAGFVRSGGTEMPVPIAASAEVINEAIRIKGIQIAAAHGFVLAAGDTVRIFGGAVPNVS
jgi:hypothetical protein